MTRLAMCDSVLSSDDTDDVFVRRQLDFRIYVVLLCVRGNWLYEPKELWGVRLRELKLSLYLVK
ncbi:hypothetical protein DVH05_000938 [Phytophthora capsici]|nr:hypothetical protein DVH05_000938 [Phytophthora capsici]